MQKIGFSMLLVLLVAQCPLTLKYGITSYTKAERAPGSQPTDTLDTGYAVYTFQQVASGNYLEVAGNIFYNEKYQEGAGIRQHGLSKTNGTMDDWQKWYIIYNSTAGGKKYYTVRNVFSGQILGYQGGTGAGPAGPPLRQGRASKHPTDGQLWRFQRVGGSRQYSVVNKATGKAMSSLALNAKDSAAVRLSPLDSRKGAQLWTLDKQPLTAYRDDQVVRFFNRNKSTMGSVAFDEGMSIPLQWGPNKGKVLWITQDAWDGSALQANNQFKCTDFFQYRNSVMIQPSITDWNPENTFNITRAGSLQNRPKQIFDVVPHTEYAWPAAGVEIGNHVYVQCGEGSGLGPNVSQSLYELKENENYLWTVKRITPAGMTTEKGINYSSGMVKGGDGFVYVFGHQPIGYGYTENAYVARFPLTDPMGWTFWDGSNWGDKPVTGEKARIAGGFGTVAISYIKGKYVFVSMTQGFNCEADRDLYVATAVSPTGPFTALKKVYTIHEYLYGSYARYYTPAIHPEFDNGREELLITYCLNFSGCGVPDCKDGYLDPYFYRVKGIRVPYAVIGL